MRLKLCALALAAAATGCANRPPNTPGAGYGAAYTPVIDMQGVDPARYQVDLADCRGYARAIDANQRTIDGIIGGAILGAAMGAAIGGNRGMAQAGAQGGAMGGATGAGASAVAQQRQIMINCMAGRGYRALDAAFVMPAPYPVAAPVAAPAAADSLARPAIGLPPGSEPASGGLMPSYLPPGSPNQSQEGTSSATPGCAWVGYQWKCPPR